LSYLFVALTVAFTVYGQMVLKWQMGLHGELLDKPNLWNVLRLVFMPWILSAFFAAFLASLAWMAAINRLPLSRAYPYMSVNFLLVAVLATLIFKERMDAWKAAGILIIIIGVVVLSLSEK